ncbi:putative dopey, N-terminal [Lyophyllum shimeji]|uniref:Dopey, N-terminal n=1 Tax=Lyophyllum shimeji TaxID=47721 RepID=A0A9P3PV75_LYOSH|nr:putative dopey, N-terminal [Lyophyllum shimeji]
MSATSPKVTTAEGAGTSVTKGSAWIAARASERAVAQQAFASDPKYKKFAQQVEKCLNSFDNVHEWADCIAFLKQLLKTFQSYTQFKEIPRKLIVAKRLSQCLNPALPTGVHQRALDVYLHILSVIGPDGLKADLSIWSPGLFPFFEYAATSVKPTLLNLYDTYYLPLQSSLRPVMKAMILTLLPGLEEETSEYFEKVLNLLDRLSGTVSPSFFFQNIWLIMLTTPPARGTSLNFLARRLPRLTPNEDISEVVGKDIGLMIRAFSAALEDDNLLVRRGALDLLLQSMRVDSAAVRKAQAYDRAILMRAATGVVLRRDLSLNRRLYTWLLGSDEKSEHQLEYLKTNALDLLHSTLKNEMFSPSGEYSESRPFKIFISLLDKWEIGAPLSQILVYDAFKAIKNLVEHPSDGGEDVTMTANTLYEAVEPQILWKQLLGAMFAEVLGDGEQFEAIHMVLFILKAFAQDDEIQTIHLPIIFAAILDIIDIQVQADATRAFSPLFRETLLLQEEMLRHIPHSALMQRPDLVGPVQATRATQRPYLFACSFYGIEPVTVPATSRTSFAVPFVSAFESLASVSLICAQALPSGSADITTLREVFSHTLVLIDRLVGRLGTSLTISWDPSGWLRAVLQALEHESANFTTVDRTVSLIVALHQTVNLTPRPSIDDRPTMYKMVNKLLKYLHANLASYHVRAVNLIWSLEAATKQPHVESILAQSMTSPESRNIHESYEAFGVLWRLTEDNLLPGFRFKVPMMIVLETLKSDDPSLRRIGETWMRCSLKSYLRVLDPILYELLDPSILRRPSTAKVHGREIQMFLYERPFDQRYINHLLDILLSVIRFGGQGFAKTARLTPVRRSHHSGLIQRVEAWGIPDQDASYLDALVEVVLRFIQSEPNKLWGPTMLPNNSIIQSTAVDLLQAIVARGDIDNTVDGMEAIVVGKLYFCVHLQRLDLQNKLLHLLHSLISASTARNLASRHAMGRQDGSASSMTGHEAEQETRSYSVNSLLIQALVDGIAVRSNRAVLQHWLDFILMAVPQFQPALQAAVGPLNDCLCRQLSASLKDIHVASSGGQDYAKDVSCSATDAEMIMLLNGLERMVLLSLAYTSELNASEEETTALEKSGTENSGLLGYVSNVFGSENVQQAPDEQLTARSPAYRALDEGIHVLYSIWGTLFWNNPSTWSSKDESLSLIYNRTRIRSRRVLEHLFRAQAVEVFESIVDCWSRDLHNPDISPDAAFELVDVLVSSAQNAVHMICESISCRISGLSERNRKQAINPNLNEGVLFKFLEQYLRRLEGPIAVQVWGRFLQLIKEIVGSTKDFKAQNFPALSCLTVLAEKITQTTAMEDRRVRKELQDNFGKLLDSAVMFVGRSYDQGSWIRRSTKESLVANGRDTPAPRDGKTDEKLDASTSLLPPDTPKPGASTELITQINEFIASFMVPSLRKFLVDNDKVVAACNNIVYYIVSPAMRGKNRPMEVDPPVLAILREMARIPSAIKAWKTPVAELLNDNRLFNCNAAAAQPWRPIVKTLFDADKAAFPELLSKVATAPSANIFTNREYEMLLRSLNVRRLSFVIFNGDKNHFLTQLPTIQEKLVDIFRNVTSPIVQCEVFLCIRVLLCRLSPHNLTSFWPVLLMEMYRIFEQVMITLPADGSEDLQLILAASKCLDLLLVLQTQEFQIHQWIYVTDTVDAIYRPDNWFPEAMMDQLAEIAGALPVADGANGIATPNLLPTFSDQPPLRRPMLNSLRQIESIRDLVPFFSNVSITSYESVYASGGNVDWEAVESGIMDDLFDGR